MRILKIRRLNAKERLVAPQLQVADPHSNKRSRIRVSQRVGDTCKYEVIRVVPVYAFNPPTRTIEYCHV